jgi:glucan biosynthesis protein C
MKNSALPVKTRLYYIDYLRVALTFLVIAHHVGQAYGPTGGAWPVQEAARAGVLGPFFTVNRSFFMSLFFMISGYFVVGAYDRSGPGAFIRGRLLRLGVPALVFAVVMIPLRIFLFGERITSWVSVFDVGHLWYLEHVLLFSLGYALWRKLRPAPVKADLSQAPLPRHLTILALALVIAVLSGLVRIWSPIDRWFNLLGFFKVAFADVPRDLAFFIVGVLAYPRGWFERYPTRAGIGWLAVGLAAAAAWYAYDLALGRFFPLSGTAFDIVRLLWEGLFCCGMCVGLLVLFRQVFHSQGVLGRLLAENQYSAYFWHPLLIVPLQMAFLGVPLAPFPKFVLVTLVGVPVVFLWSHLLRRPRIVRAVL